MKYLIIFMALSFSCLADTRYIDPQTQEVVTQYIDNTNLQIVQLTEQIKTIDHNINLLRSELYLFEEKVCDLLKEENYAYPTYKGEFPPYSGSSLNP